MVSTDACVKNCHLHFCTCEAFGPQFLCFEHGSNLRPLFPIHQQHGYVSRLTPHSFRPTLHATQGTATKLTVLQKRRAGMIVPKWKHWWLEGRRISPKSGEGVDRDQRTPGDRGPKRKPHCIPVLQFPLMGIIQDFNQTLVFEVCHRSRRHTVQPCDGPATQRFWACF